MRSAFAMEGPHGALTEKDRELLDRLAAGIVRRRMALPALLFLRSVGPLNAIGSQLMTFLRPFLTPLFNPAEYDRMRDILERRESVAALAEAVEAARDGNREQAK